VRAEDLSWPKATSTTKPWSRWWWLGSEVTDAGLKSEMEKYAAAGLGGLEITPIYGVKGQEDQFIPYLSPKWVDRFLFTLKEAKSLNMQIDMATGTGWPWGGPWVTPDDTCKYMADKTFTVKAGEKLNEPVAMIEKFMVAPRNITLSQLKEPFGDTPNLQQLAIDNLKMPNPLKLNLLMAFSDKVKEPLNLTDKVDAKGNLDWTAPADSGTWTLYAIFDGLHSRMVKRAAPGGEGHVPDHLSSEAISHYLGKFDTALAGKNLDGFRSYFSDSYEVDNGTPGSEANFTPHFFEEFQKRRGYDLRPLLPVLLEKKSSDQYTRILCDYRETVSDLLLDGFTKTWQAWAAKQGKLVRNQAHGSPGNLLDLYAAVDIPETEGFGGATNADAELTMMLKMMYASSAAHLTGHPLASSETCTWLDDHFLTTLGHAKERVDTTLLAGINHILYHGTPYSPPEEKWPGDLFYAAVEFCPANSWWDDFAALNKYVERCQSFLQAGQPDNDVLVYAPIFDDWMKPGRGGLVHYAVEQSWPGQEVGRQLLKAGYTFDYMSDRLLQGVKYEQNTLICGGNKYKFIMLPETKFIPMQTLEKLMSLADQGAQIVFLKSYPSDVPGLKNFEENRAKLKAQFASLGPSTSEFSGSQTNKVGKGKFTIVDSATRALRHREEMVDQGLEFVRRRDGESRDYFIVNRNSNKSIDGWVPLSREASGVAIFDPLTGQSGRGALRAREFNDGIDKGSEVYLQLQPGQSCIVKTFDSGPTGQDWPYHHSLRKAESIEGKWNVTFIKGGPELPKAAEIDSLKSWTEFGGDAGKVFSGTAKYTLKLAKPQAAGAAYRLDLDKVGDSARVSLNGEELGVLFTSPFTIDIPADKFKAENTLEVSVSNLMANRIADMDKKGVQWKRFYNANVAAHDAVNRGAGGLFSAANWSPRPSGLLGPMTLTPLEQFDPLKTK
jgi:hypothetical protein